MNAAAKVQRRKGAEPCFKPIASDRREVTGRCAMRDLIMNGFR